MFWVNLLVRKNCSIIIFSASGEPALCLASVLTHAIREAVMAARLDAGYEDKWLDIRTYIIIFILILHPYLFSL